MGVWILLSSLQILGIAHLNRTYEVLFAACAVSILSCLHQAPERTELLALRSFVFVVANATLPYLGVMLQHPEIDTYVNACRTLLILLGEPEVASSWVAVYIICIGYQVRNSAPSVVHGPCNHSKKTMIKYPQSYYKNPAGDDCDEETSYDCADYAVFATKQPLAAQPAAATPPSSTTTASEEAALLREALASRKGFREH
jgi:hypothetical protein